MNHGPDHAHQALRGRIENNWGYNGNAYRSPDSANSDKPESMLSVGLSGFFALLDDAVPMLFEGGSDFFRTGKNYVTPNHDHQIPRRQSMLSLAKTLAKQPFEPISTNGFRYLFTRNRKSQTRALARFSPYQNRQAGVRTSKIILEYLLELDGSSQSQPSRERFAGIRGHVKA